MENYSIEMYNSVSSYPYTLIQKALYDTLISHSAVGWTKIYVQVGHVILNWFSCLILSKIEFIKIMYRQAFPVHYTHLQLLLVNYAYLSHMTECYQQSVMEDLYF